MADVLAAISCYGIADGFDLNDDYMPDCPFPLGNYWNEEIQSEL